MGEQRSEPLIQFGAATGAGAEVRGKIREGSSQKGTSELGLEEYIVYQAIRNRKVIPDTGKSMDKGSQDKKGPGFLGEDFPVAGPTSHFPHSCPWTRNRTDKGLARDYSLCLHSQPPLTRAISSKGLSKIESGGTCQRRHRTHRPRHQ